jgi:hypothetical protein
LTSFCRTDILPHLPPAILFSGRSPDLKHERWDFLFTSLRLADAYCGTHDLYIAGADLFLITHGRPRIPVLAWNGDISSSISNSPAVYATKRLLLTPEAQHQTRLTHRVLSEAVLIYETRST